jgi:hypothetical protein
MLLTYLLGAAMSVGQAPPAPLGTFGVPEIIVEQAKAPEPVPAPKRESKESPMHGKDGVNENGSHTGNGNGKKKKKTPILQQSLARICRTVRRAEASFRHWSALT